MTIKEMEDRVGISKANIRFYEKEGLLSPARGFNNYREYTEKDVENLEKIKCLRTMGIPVSDIRLYADGKIHLNRLLERRQDQIEQEMTSLMEIKHLCTRLKNEEWDYESFDPFILESQKVLWKQRGREAMKKDRIANEVVDFLKRLSWRFCILCIISIFLTPVNLIFHVSFPKDIVDIWEIVVLLSPLPFFLLHTIWPENDQAALQKKWGMGEVKRARNKSEGYEPQITKFNQLCHASIVIIPLNKILGIQWPVWMTGLWLVIVFGSVIALAVVKNR